MWLACKAWMLMCLSWTAKSGSCLQTGKPKRQQSSHLAYTAAGRRARRHLSGMVVNANVRSRRLVLTASNAASGSTASICCIPKLARMKTSERGNHFAYQTIAECARRVVQAGNIPKEFLAPEKFKQQAHIKDGETVHNPANLDWHTLRDLALCAAPRPAACSLCCTLAAPPAPDKHWQCALQRRHPRLQQLSAASVPVTSWATHSSQVVDRCGHMCSTRRCTRSQSRSQRPSGARLPASSIGSRRCAFLLRLHWCSSLVVDTMLVHTGSSANACIAHFDTCWNGSGEGPVDLSVRLR
jgi:hypothetical protein